MTIPLRIYLRGSSFRIVGDAVYRYPGGYAGIMCMSCKEELEGPIQYKIEEGEERGYKYEDPLAAWPKNTYKIVKVKRLDSHHVNA